MVQLTALPAQVNDHPRQRQVLQRVPYVHPLEGGVQVSQRRHEERDGGRQTQEERLRAMQNSPAVLDHRLADPHRQRRQEGQRGQPNHPRPERQEGSDETADVGRADDERAAGDAPRRQRIQTGQDQRVVQQAAEARQATDLPLTIQVGDEDDLVQHVDRGPEEENRQQQRQVDDRQQDDDNRDKQG